MKCFYLPFLVAITFFIGVNANAQDPFPTTVTDQNQGVNLPFPQSFGGSVDQVSVENGNLTINIPIVNTKGRGLTYNFGLRYGSAFWGVPNLSKPVWSVSAGNYLPGHVVGWETTQPYATWVTQTYNCGTNGHITTTGSYIFTDSAGAKHQFPMGTETGVNCSGNGAGGYTYTNAFAPDTFSDGVSASTNSSGNVLASVSFKDGTVLTAGGAAPPPPALGYSTGLAVLTDTNGNTQSSNPGGTDSIGRTPVTVTTNGSEQIIYQVTDSNGKPQNYTVNLESIPINTGFNSGPQEASGVTFLEVGSIQLPSGQAYSFSYDGYGDITKLTLPSGAQILYSWDTVQDGTNSHRYVTSRTTTVDGITSVWKLSIVCPSAGCGVGPTNTVTDPGLNQQVYSFTGNFATSVKLYNGTASGSPIRQYTIQAFDPTNLQSSLPGIVDTTLDNGLVSRQQYTYYESTYAHHFSGPGVSPTTTQETMSNGDITAIQEYAFGNGSPGPLVRQTFKTYLYQVSSGVPSRVTEEDIFDGSATCTSASTCTAILVSKTLNTYDGNNAASSHKGNLTSSARLVSTPSTYATTGYSYDGYGNIIAETDPKQNATTWSYANQWDSGTNSCNPTGSSAYPTLKTDALGHQTSYTWHACTGQLQSVQNANDLANGRAGTTYNYDEMGNPTSTNYPDGGSVSYNYNGYSLPLTVTATQSASPDPSVVTTTIYDGLDRVAHTTVGGATVDTTYDAFGRVASVSNPYISKSDSTYGITSYLYDALGRKTFQCQPDNSSTNSSSCVTQNSYLQWLYTGNAIDFYDETRRHWQRTYDALGRLIKVLEPDGSTNTSVTPTLVTNYAYNALDNLTQVNQHGLIRGFSYDSLSRLITATNPESGTICYGVVSGASCINGYDANGNLIAKTDARGIVTTYTYDALNHLTGKSYNDAKTPSSCYQYAPSSTSGANLIGRLVNEWTQTASAGACPATLPANGFLTRRSILAYDPMGRVTSEQQCTPSNCTSTTPYALTYGYDLAGNLGQYTNGIGSIMLSPTYDGATHLKTVASSWSDSLHPSTLFSATSVSPPAYNAAGGLMNATYGNGLTLSRTYDNRLRITGEIDTGSIVPAATAGSATVTITGAEQSH